MSDQIPSPGPQGAAERPAPVVPEQPKGAEAPAPAAAEQAPAPAAEAAPAGPAAAPAPVPEPPADAAVIAAATGSKPVEPPAAAGPALAGDVDVIEPEWVAKAEEVVAAHRGDPYGEEEAIEELQQDYMQKRYGISVSDPDDGDVKPQGS